MVSDDTKAGLRGNTRACLNPCFNGIWSRTLSRGYHSRNQVPVLILVLMEYGLGVMNFKDQVKEVTSLNPCFNGIWSRSSTLHISTVLCANCLNPCFNGTWSQICPHLTLVGTLSRLNPCFNGIWSRTETCEVKVWMRDVLILVLMEYGLGPRAEAAAKYILYKS